MEKNDDVGAFFEDPMWKNCTPVARSAFSNEITKDISIGPLFEVPMSKNCTAVARSAFVSQKVQNSCVLAHFLKFRCGKGFRQKR